MTCRWFDKLATVTAAAVGTPVAMMVFLAVVLVWLAGGAPLSWSDTWHLLINTPTTIVTTGLVILVQYTQNKNDRALHLKLDVLIEASGASNRYAAVEDLNDQELRDLRDKAVAAIGDDTEGEETP